MGYNFIEINFAPLAGLLFLLLFLLSNREADEKIRRIFSLLGILELVELIVYSTELWTATFAEPTVWRILLSAVGYTIRPFLLYLILWLSVRGSLADKWQLIFAIPALLNAIAAFSAFFTDLVYSYNASNEFVRGPLGYTTYIVALLYLFCILVLALVKKAKGRRLECAIALSVSLVCTVAMFFEAFFSVRSLGRTSFVLSTIAYYIYFQTQAFRDDIADYMEQTIQSQKEHLREMNIISVLASEYVTVCYVDVEKNLVNAYRMDPFIEKQYGDMLRLGVSFEKVFRAYVTQNIHEEDREFFLRLAELPDMFTYLKQNGSLSRKYRVWRNGTILYCEMRAELVRTETGAEDIVFGFSNNDMRIHREMVYQSTVKEELAKVEEAKNSLSGIASLARQLQEAIEDKLSGI